MACPAVPDARPTCTLRRCGYACERGRGDCDGNPANGCEVNIFNDILNCNGCGIRCMFCGEGVCVGRDGGPD
jgi:hypothetical protein